MIVEPEFSYFAEARPAVLVVSHERSGTHFLMNALAACYGYVNLPWIDLDLPTDNILHFYPRHEIRKTLLGLAERPMANIVKSHHAADFFVGELGCLAERYVIFAVHRDPVAVMLSSWRYMHRFAASDNPGPQVADPLTFARAEPFGRLLRYQTRPYASMLERWAAHVQGWRAAAAACPRVVLVRYEDLDARYEETVQGFAQHLGQPPEALIRPPRDFNIIVGGPPDPRGTGIPPDIAALRQLCRQTVGETMACLGY